MVCEALEVVDPLDELALCNTAMDLTETMHFSVKTVSVPQGDEASDDRVYEWINSVLRSAPKTTTSPNVRIGIEP